MEPEIKLTIAKANDIIRLCNERNIPKFSGFLSLAEQSAILPLATANGALLYGGYDEAERRMLGALPQFITEPYNAFPILAVRFSYRAADTLSHRDVLGALMALGIKRQSVGDIVFSSGTAVAFVTKEIAEYISKQITKIGRVGVTAEVVSPLLVAKEISKPLTKELTFTVSSPRIDAVLSSLVGCSRGAAEQYVKDGLVYINSILVTKPTKQVSVNDKITLRGTGKFVITGSGNFSKKGREIITAQKYI